MTASNYSHVEPNVVLFGGSFDPPHLGHVEAIKIVQRRFPAARILLIPSFAPPTSRSDVKLTFASFSDRVAMSVIAFDELSNLEVSTCEENLQKPNYTVQTVKYMRQEFPVSKLSWLVGGDQLQKFSTWLEPRSILELASLIVVPRPDQISDDLMEIASSVVTNLGYSVSADKPAGVLSVDGACPVFILKEAPAGISSSEIRAKVRVGDLSANDYLTSGVQEYIVDWNLYKGEA